MKTIQNELIDILDLIKNLRGDLNEISNKLESSEEVYNEIYKESKNFTDSKETE